MFEKRFAAISLQPFIANGTSSGVITVVNASLFKVKQEVIVQANTLPNLDTLEVKEVISMTQLRVGPKGTPIVGPSSQIDLSAYTTILSAGIFSNEQKRTIIKEEEFNRAVYEEEPTVAIRSFLVDKLGRGYTTENPLPTTATISGDVTIGTDGYDLANPDSMNATGSEDGTETGIKHSLRVDSELDLRVGISDGLNKATVNGSGELSVKDADVLNRLDSGILSIGTEDGTPTGTQNVFINDIKNMVLSIRNRTAAFTYADFGTKNERVTKIDYTSPTFPGTTVRRVFNYTLVGNNYRRDNEVWSVV